MARALFAEIVADRRTRRPDDLAFLHGTKALGGASHFEEMRIEDDASFHKGIGGLGSSFGIRIVLEGLCPGQRTHPLAVAPIDDLAVAQAVRSQDLQEISHFQKITCQSRKFKTSQLWNVLYLFAHHH